MHDLFLSIGFGLVTASILALSAVALSLQYSVTNVPNFAHGDLMTVGAYGAFVAQSLTHNLLIEIVVASLCGGTVAFAMNRLLMQPFIRKGSKNLILFILTIATSIVIQSSLLFIFGGSNVAYQLSSGQPQQIGPFLLTRQDQAIIGAAVAVMLVVHLILRYTKFGKAQRAIADSRELARVTGINAARVVQLTWLMAGLIAGLAGFILAANISSFGPTLGFSFLVVTFAAAVVGGIGKPYGAMAGAVLVGLAMEVSALYIPPDYKTAVAFGLLILTLLIRPAGLFATRRWNVAEA
jgi:branched-subunit amino acid ABC-type transport system permease component